MDKLDSIINHYKQLSTDELLIIAQKPDEIAPETISILQNELINRDEFEVAFNLKSYVTPIEKPLSELTEIEISEIVRERVSLGESIESIQMDLKSKGVNILNFMNQEVESLEEKYKYILSLRKEGLDEEEISQRVKQEFDINENENEAMKIELRRKGVRNIKIGYLLIFVSIIIFLINMALEQAIFTFPFILFIGGIVLISKGHQQKK
jgi:hypothetical protein